MHLKKFGRVKVFRRTFKNEAERSYIIHLPASDATEQISRQEFKQLPQFIGELKAITELLNKYVVLL